jgi:hypothetical protein
MSKWNRYFFIATLLFIVACKKDHETITQPVPDLKTIGPELPAAWADMSLFVIRFSAFNSPTYTSRSLGYLGLCMYECVVPGDSSYRSMSGQLNGLTLPVPPSGEKIHWLIALNAGQDTLLKLLYPVPANSHRYVHEKIDSLYLSVYEEQSKGISKSTIDRSIEWGRNIALAIYNWSLTDGGDKGYTKNFDQTFQFPKGPSYWVPPQRGQTISPYPLHPHWGDNRTFVSANSHLPVPAIVPYSTDTASAYYKLYKAVYDKDKTLTQDEMEMSAWWGDDPTETFSPPGHSYAIASIAVRQAKSNIVLAAESYARTGLAVADAFINCWRAKVVYFNERPSSYVKKNIDSTWIQFWPEPPFPAFPSGHSIQSAAAATVMTALYGDNFGFTDHSHEGHRRYDDVRFFNLRYPPRTFHSFWDAAQECAYSRFLGGIHTQQDNDAGAAEGKIIGEHVNALKWRN